MAYGGKPSLSYKQKRRSFLNPRVLIVVLVIVFLGLCLIGRGSFSRIGCTNDTGVLQNYVTQVKKITDRTNKIGTDFADLRTNMKSLARKTLDERLTTMAKDSRTILTDAKEIEVPPEMADAHNNLLMSLELRAIALENYKPAVFNALSDQDLEVSGKQVALAMRDLAFSDRAFGLFKDKVTKALKDNDITFITAPASVFLAGETEYEVANVLEFLRSVKEAGGDLTEKHGIGIAEVVVEPAAVSENDDGVSVLPAADTITVTVTIENQGNQLEVNIPVEATLKSETQPKPQQKELSVSSLPAGQKKSVKFTALKPTPGDIVNMLTIRAGPVPNEQWLDNNVSEIKFTMQRK